MIGQYTLLVRASEALATRGRQRLLPWRERRMERLEERRETWRQVARDVE